jgi:hypothetical protein
LAKPNYQFEKRKRDIAKKAKKEEKKLRKLRRSDPSAYGGDEVSHYDQNRKDTPLENSPVS